MGTGISKKPDALEPIVDRKPEKRHEEAESRYFHFLFKARGELHRHDLMDGAVDGDGQAARADGPLRKGAEAGRSNTHVLGDARG
eukprot:3932146-Rhodomonas_salina.2